MNSKSEGSLVRSPLSFYVRAGNDFLKSTLWIPVKSRNEAVVFCHGWGGGTPYDDFLALLTDRGYWALRFEQRGYGESTGRADLSLWAEDMAACASFFGGVANRVWAAGQSTGGAIALVAATTHDCFSGAIAIASFCSLERIITDNVNARRILEGRFGPLQEKHFKAADTLGFVRRLRKPVLLVHGTEDQSVPFEHGRLLYTELGTVARFIPVQGGDHHLTNVDRSPLLLEMVVWLESQG